MALQELRTNAVKYGALGQPGGQLGVTWRVQDDRGEGRVVLALHLCSQKMLEPLTNRRQTQSN
jgi:two-component sensor histidine kinase